MIPWRKKTPLGERSGVCQGNLPLPPDQQRSAKGFLQILDLAADGWLGRMKPLRRLCDVAFLRFREKLDRGDLDFGILVEPVEVAKYDFLRLSVREICGRQHV